MLEIGDVVLVQEWGYGISEQDVNQYVILREKYKDDPFLGRAWNVEGYECSLHQSNNGKMNCVYEKSFGDAPLVLFNVNEGNSLSEKQHMKKEKKEFDIGDRVICVKDTPEISEGWIGFIVRPCDVYGYEAEWEGGSQSYSFREDELELLEKAKKETVQVQPQQQYTGGSSDYYKVFVKNPTTLEAPYEAECNDVIEALQMTFAEGNAFKAIWRKAKARQGVKKKGYDNGVYDSEKVVFFGERMLIEAKDKDESI